MPEKLFFFSKVFLVLAWIVHIGVVSYSFFKVVKQEANWAENASHLFDAQKKLKGTAFLIFFFIILISIWSFRLNNQDCLVCLSKWYKYNAVVEVIFLIAYLSIIILNLIYKTHKYYDKNAKAFLKKALFKTLLSILVCLLMSIILIPEEGLFISRRKFMKIWKVIK